MFLCQRNILIKNDGWFCQTGKRTRGFKINSY